MGDLEGNELVGDAGVTTTQEVCAESVAPTILIALNSLGIGGSQTVAVNLARLAHSSGWNVIVVGRDGIQSEVLRREGIETFWTPIRQGTAWDAGSATRLRNWPNIARELVKTLGSLAGVLLLLMRTYRKVDVIHASQPWPTAIAVICGVLTRIPVVWHVHGTSRVEMPLPVWRWTCRQLAAVVAISPEVARAVERYLPSGLPVTVFASPSTVDMSLRSMPRASGGGVRIAFCATLTRNKMDCLAATLHAAGLIATSGKDVCVVTVGDGSCMSEARAEAARMERAYPGLTVEFRGAVSPSYAAYTDADVVVGMGLVAVEAIQLGHRVVVASSDGVGGLIGVHNYDQLRDTNFTGRGVYELSGERLVEAIGEGLQSQVDAGLAARVSADFGSLAAFSAFDRLWRSLGC